MKAKFFDRENESNPLNGQVFDSDNRFAEVLDHNRLRTPFYCELEGENGQNLLIGIAQNCGCVQFSSADGSPPYWMALGSSSEAGKETIEFAIGGTPSAVSQQYIVPFEDLVQNQLPPAERAV